MQTVNFSIPNISCGHCVHTITMELGALDGVRSVEASPDTKTATVSFEAPATEDQITALLKEINYPAA